MEPFYYYHPGSKIGSALVEEKQELIQKAINEPLAAINFLNQKYKFGQKSDFWDDFVFSTILHPALSNIVELKNLKDAITKYCAVDHALFATYIRRDEDPIRFRRAFWNVNTFGKYLAKRFKKYYFSQKDIDYVSSSPIRDSSRKKIAFIFKGRFHLAHAEFFKEFLRGTKVFSSKVDITLILLDDKEVCLKSRDLDHIKTISFNKYGYYDKLRLYYEFASKQKFDHIAWIACVQNLSLYMGQKLAPSQSYWSMKYHSIIMDSLDKYAGLGFGGKSFSFDDIEWFRGRAFPDLSLPICSRDKLLKLKKSKNIPADVCLLGCFVRSEKLNNTAYWDLIESLLTNHQHVHFAIASQSIPEIATKYLRKDLFRKKFHHLGWVNTKEWSQCLDIYFDSFPRGSCLTALEAIKAKTPLVMFDTEHNRESSALPYLMSANMNQIPPDIVTSTNIDATFSILNSLIEDKDKRSEFAANQYKLLSVLEGQSPLYAKDYLNYFLNTNLSVRDSVQ